MDVANSVRGLPVISRHLGSARCVGHCIMNVLAGQDATCDLHRPGWHEDAAAFCCSRWQVTELIGGQSSAERRETHSASTRDDDVLYILPQKLCPLRPIGALHVIVAPQERVDALRTGVQVGIGLPGRVIPLVCLHGCGRAARAACISSGVAGATAPSCAVLNGRAGGRDSVSKVVGCIGLTVAVCVMLLCRYV